MSDMAENFDKALVIDCSRCANQGVSYEPTPAAAERELLGQGWTYDDPHVYCPACSGVTT